MTVAPFVEAAELRAGAWVRVTEEWPTEVVKVTRCGPVLDLDERGPRRHKVRVRLASGAVHELREDTLVCVY